MTTTGGAGPSSGPLPSGGGPASTSGGKNQDVSKDGLLAIAPRNSEGRPTLGGIPLVKKLGQGGMGAVYLGTHPRLGVEVAVKVLPFHLADQDPNSIQYFMREAQSMARLNHNNLVRVFDVNVDGDPQAGSAIWFLVMEYVHGKTAGALVRERIKAGQGPLPEADALDLMMAVSDGLAAAHDEHFVHRDIKPDNIIIPLDKDGQPQLKKAKLMDLGLAKPAQDEGAVGLTGTNIAMGTPGYMAPEQAESAKTVTPAADIFSMGGTLYTLLSGVAPFAGNTVLTVLKKTSEEPHLPIRQLNPAVSEPTGVLIDTALAKNPADRYATAGILRDALKACRDSIEGTAEPQLTLMSLRQLQAFKPPEPAASDIVTVRATPGQPAQPSGPLPPPKAGGGAGKWAALAGLGCLGILGLGGLIIWLAFFTGGSVEEWRREAAAAESAGNYDGAIALYEKILKKKPDDDAAKAVLASLRTRRTEAEYEKYMAQGRAALKDERWEDAETAYLKAQEAKATADAKRGLDDARRGRSADAEYLRKLQEGDEHFDRERYDLAERAYRDAQRLKDTAAAKSGIERAVQKRKETEAIARFVKEASDAVSRGKDDEAWARLTEGVKAFPNSYDLRVASARLAKDKGPYSWLGTAIDDAARAFQLAGTNAAKSGEAASLKTELEKRKAELDKTAGVLAQIEEAIKKGDLAGAEKLLSQVPPANAKDREGFRQRIETARAWQSALADGQAAEQSGRLGEALAAYKKAQGLRADDAVTNEAVARVEGAIGREFDAACGQADAAIKAGDFGRAREHLTRAESLRPDDPRTAQLDEELRFQEPYAHALAAKKEGRTLEALEKLDQAIKVRKDPAAMKLRSELEAAGALAQAFAALKSGDRMKAVALARQAAANTPGAPELVQLEDQLWPDLFVERQSVAAKDFVDQLLVTKGGNLVGVGRGFQVFGPDTLDARGGRAVANGFLYGPTLVEEGGLKVAGVSAPPSEPNQESQPILLWSEAGVTKLEMGTADFKFPVKGSRVAALDGNTLIRTMWTAGGSDEKQEPDYYTIDLMSAEGKMGGDRHINSAQGHLVLSVNPDRSGFATAGGIYRTWKRSGSRVEPEERKQDTQVYLWNLSFEKRPVDLGEPVGKSPALGWSADGTKLLVATDSRKLFVVDVGQLKVVARHSLPGAAESVVGVPGRSAGAVVAGGKVHLFDLEGAWFASPSAFGAVRSVAFSLDGRSMFTGGEDGKLHRFVLEPLRR